MSKTTNVLQTLHSMQTVLFNRLVELSPTISFPCMVNGIALTATITHKEIMNLQTLYHIQFSDGHKNNYVAGDAEMKDGFGRTRTPDTYEEAVFEDLCVVKYMEKGSWYINVRVAEVEGASYNVWIREKGGYYSVYYKGQYQFTLRKKEVWESGTMRERGYVVNGRLAKLLVDYLEKHYLQQPVERLRRA